MKTNEWHLVWQQNHMIACRGQCLIGFCFISYMSLYLCLESIPFFKCGKFMADLSAMLTWQYKAKSLIDTYVSLICRDKKFWWYVIYFSVCNILQSLPGFMNYQSIFVSWQANFTWTAGTQTDWNYDRTHHRQGLNHLCEAMTVFPYSLVVFTTSLFSQKKKKKSSLHKSNSLAWLITAAFSFNWLNFSLWFQLRVKRAELYIMQVLLHVSQL